MILRTMYSRPALLLILEVVGSNLTRLVWFWLQLFQFIFSCRYEIYSSLVQRLLIFLQPQKVMLKAYFHRSAV